jgi:phosphohistidine phosphatase SixA
MKQLLLLRHAEAEDLGLSSNLMRSLTINGVVQAKAVRKLINVKIDKVLCSSALRCRQTLEALDLDAQVIFSKTLFKQESLKSIIDEVQEAGKNVDVLLVVMHMPSILELANHYGANLNGYGKASLCIFRFNLEQATFQALVKP